MKKISSLVRKRRHWCSSPTAALMAVLVMLATPGFPQGAEMADAMRSDGKIYVVVAIILVVLAGLIGYLIYIDRKTSHLEKKLDQNRHS